MNRFYSVARRKIIWAMIWRNFLRRLPGERRGNDIPASLIELLPVGPTPRLSINQKVDTKVSTIEKSPKIQTLSDDGTIPANRKITHERSFRGIGTGGSLPTGSVPVQKQCHLVPRSVGHQVGTKRPDVGRRIGRQSKQTIRLIDAVRPNIRARHPRPARAVAVFDKGQRGD